MPPVGPVAGGLFAIVTALVEPSVAGFAGAGCVKAIGCAFVMFGLETAGEFGGITFTLTNGGFEFAQVRACRLVSKNLSTTIALRSLIVRPDFRAALRFRTALPVSTALRAVPSGRTTRLPYGIRFGSTAQCPCCKR